MGSHASKDITAGERPVSYVPRSPPTPARSNPSPHKQPASPSLFPQLDGLRREGRKLTVTRLLSTSGFVEDHYGHYAGEMVSVKRLQPGRSEEENLSLANTLAVMERLNHPKVVRLIGAVWTTRQDLQAMTEYMVGGDLHSLLQNKAVAMSWADLKLTIAIDVAEALAYLHALRPQLIHRDIRARNIMLTKHKTAKISGFGLARDRSFASTMTSGVGSTAWTAPEILTGDEYNEKADVYSFGVLLSELDTRQEPLVGTDMCNDTDEEVRNKIATGQIRPIFSPECPREIREIAKACLQYDPSLRASSADVHRMLVKAFRVLRTKQTRP